MKSVYFLLFVLCGYFFSLDSFAHECDSALKSATREGGFLFRRINEDTLVYESVLRSLTDRKESNATDALAKLEEGKCAEGLNKAAEIDQETWDKELHLIRYDHQLNPEKKMPLINGKCRQAVYRSIKAQYDSERYASVEQTIDLLGRVIGPPTKKKWAELSLNAFQRKDCRFGLTWAFAALSNGEVHLGKKRISKTGASNPNPCSEEGSGLETVQVRTNSILPALNEGSSNYLERPAKPSKYDIPAKFLKKRKSYTPPDSPNSPHTIPLE